MLKINHLDRKKLLNQSNRSTLTLFDNETNAKTDSIINDALNCIIQQIPDMINRLNLFYNEIIIIMDDYSPIHNNKMEIVNKLNGWRKNLFHCKRRLQPKYSADLNDLSENNFRTEILRQCARHFYNPKHRCWNRYTHTDQMLNIKPERIIPNNKQLDQLVNQFQAINIDLSQQLLKISTGFSLLFPKSDDNEQNNLSLDVIQTIIDMSSLPSFDFTSYSMERSSLIKLINYHPYSEETCFMLNEYDLNFILELRIQVQFLLIKCCRIYDLFMKNFERVLQTKKQSKIDDFNPADSIYS